MSTKWTHKVLKRVRNGDQWRDYPTAATFDSEAEAIAYAKEFADEQSAAHIGLPIRIVVRKRNGDPVMGFPVSL